MSFRARLFLAFALAALVPLGALAIGVRGEMERRLGAEYGRRAATIVQSLRDEIDRGGAGVADRLAALAATLEVDNQFRQAVIRSDPAARRVLLDWAGSAMRLSGLAVLELHDSTGRILSSGHFRNEYDRVRAEPERLLALAGRAPILLRARTPEGTVTAVSRADSFTLSGHRFSLLGGVPLDRLVLPSARDADLALHLAIPGEPPSPRPQGEEIGELSLPVVDLAARSIVPDTGRLTLVQSGETLAAVRRGLVGWFLATFGLATALALVAAAWLSARLSRPLRELATRTEAIDLDRLDYDFPSDRQDEIGTLSRVLGAMTGRLRASAGRLREAERRVALGDLARQVNHDVKNGLTPIRNVLRHLDEVAREGPDKLAEVYGERRATLDSSVAYLDTLARNYARLTPAMDREPCDVNALVEEVARGAPAGRAELRAETAPGLPPVSADRLALRRIVENLVGNAVDSVAAGGGSVLVSTGAAGRDGVPAVWITVADTGPGMSRAQLDQAFEGFFTTKEGGTGLGLSIVRRLVLDLGGALRVDTAPGEGTRVTVELPAGTGKGE